MILLSLLAAGCATVDGPKDPRDPLESYNRAMYSFNDTFDRAIFKPVAEGYDKVMPKPVNTGISNFFSNLDDVLVLFNDLLQFKLKQGASDFSRLTWNSTVGLFGIIDVASHMDLPKHNEDFGQTLGYWGVGSGPYIVLPFLGPSTLRDGTGLVADWQVDPLARVENDQTRWGLIGLKAVDTRAGLLRATSIIETASLDPYAFMRDAYLQRRENLVYDGNPPVKNEFDPFSDEFDPLSEPATEPKQHKAP
jgi:phospholipid-binding lipoprotein MlaA